MSGTSVTSIVTSVPAIEGTERYGSWSTEYNFEEADGDEDKAIKLWHDYLTYLIERFDYISLPEDEKPSFAYWNQYMDISTAEDKDCLFPHSTSEAADKAKTIWRNAYKDEEEKEQIAIQEVFAAMPKYYCGLWD